MTKIPASITVTVRNGDDFRSKEEEAIIEPEFASTAEMPIAWYKGTLPILGTEVPCYVLSNGLRVVGRTSATELLTGIKGGGALEKYLGVSALKPYINIDLVLERMVAFRLPEVEIPWCEDCGASIEFCECGVPADDGLADWEYERRRDREMEREWERVEKERGSK